MTGGLIPSFWRDRHRIVGGDPGTRRTFGVIWLRRELVISYWKPRHTKEGK